MKYDTIIFEALADLCINLSAGWFGAAFITPAFSKQSRNVNFAILTVDIIFGILFLGLAILLRN